MPLDLPGLYWDPERDRYFPTASKPRYQPNSVPVPPSPSSPNTLGRNRHLFWDAYETLRLSSLRSKQCRAVHDIICTQVASTSRVHRSYLPLYDNNTVRSFCTAVVGSDRHGFVGDNQGWLYSSEQPKDLVTPDRWSADFNIQPFSEVSSICISGSACVATSSGSSCKIFFRDLDSSRETYILDIRGKHDVWCSHLQDRTLVLGVHNMVVYLQDLTMTGQLRYLETQSDVFSVHQREHLVFAGTRNGSIHRFDVRIHQDSHHPLFGKDRMIKGSVGDVDSDAPVRYLNVVHEWQLLISRADGNLAAFDLRFLRESNPLMVFPGHVSSVISPKLGIAVDPSEDLLFAAGEDCRIRAWSLRTGNLLCPTFLSSRNPLSRTFEEPVVELQVSEEEDGMVLWAAAGSHLYNYNLGQRNLS